HALLLETTPELPHGFGVGVGFLRAVRGRPVFKEDQGPDEFIAPLELIDKAQFQLRKVTGHFHTGSPLDAGTPFPHGRRTVEAPCTALSRGPRLWARPWPRCAACVGPRCVVGGGVL